MNILVTGGAGYIGSHMVRLLIETGHRVTVIDDLSTGHRDAVVGAELIECSLSERDRLQKVLTALRPTAVIHFAASALVGESVDDPAAYYRNNVVGTLNLLDAMRRAECRNVVFSSTAAVYGEPDRTPIPESARQSPTNPYGASKAMVERILGDYGRYGLRWAALRYFNAAGAQPDGSLAERHDPETHLIPIALDVAAGRRPSLRIFGTDWPTPDGTCVRDYVHVVDLCEAHLLALRWLREGGESRAFNLGNGQGFSVRQVARAVRQVTGVEISVIEDARRPGDPATLVADAADARRLLEWRPRFGDLETIIEHAWVSRR